jgi:hypothetical protein
MAKKSSQNADAAPKVTTKRRAAKQAAPKRSTKKSVVKTASPKKRAPTKLTREQLIELAAKAQDADDRGKPTEPLMTRLRAELPIEGLDHLILLGDEDAETKIDIALGRLEKPKTLTRDEMIELVRNIFNPQGFSEARIDLMVAQFIFNCKHPAGSDLIFWPSGHFPDDRDPTPEQIVDKAIQKN